MAAGYVYFRAGATAQERAHRLQQEEVTAVIHHSANQIRFDDANPAALLPYGRAFGPDMELRWQPEGNGRWELLLITEKKRSDLTQSSWQETTMDVDEDKKEEKEAAIFLWGKHWQSLEGAQADDAALQNWGWVQAQITADLHYPVQGSANKPMVKVKTRTYRQKGVIRLTRFTAVIPAPDEEV